MKKTILLVLISVHLLSYLNLCGQQSNYLIRGSIQNGQYASSLYQSAPNRIGLGTTNPGGKFDVQGSVGSTNGLPLFTASALMIPMNEIYTQVDIPFRARTSNDNGNTWSSIIEMDFNGRLSLGKGIPEAYLDIQSKNSNYALMKVRAKATIEEPLQPAFFVSAGRKVGLNNETPLAQLDIKAFDPDMDICLIKSLTNAELFKVTPKGELVIGGPNTLPLETLNGVANRLFVNGGILAERMKLAINGTTEWPDYVFEPTYQLTSLEDVEIYIQEKGHLPGIPSAEQVVRQGMDVEEISILLLQKIEELTLHTIELQKKINQLEEAQQNLEKDNRKIRPFGSSINGHN
jgi:hypothetical protein